MHKSYSILAFTALILAVAYFQTTSSAVIGLDFGSEYLKVSSISPGKSFYIVEDTTTKRKTPNAIGFYSNERIWESDTLVKRPKAFQTTFSNLVKFFGKSYGDQKLAEKSKYYQEDYILEKNERGGISFGLKTFKMNDDEEANYSLTLEELVGMIFRHVKDLAVKQTERQLRDIAVTVPPYWTFRERYVLQDALLLADLNPLAFISENTAAALYYALERLDEQTHTVLLYNLGSSDLKVSLIEFYVQNSTEKADKGAKIESFRVLAETWAEDVGGLSFDLNLMAHFAKEFDAKPNRAGKKSILTSNPAKAKILKEVNRLKEILSANKQASIYLENVFDSTDLKSSIDRTKFDEVNAELYTKLTKPIDEILEKTGKTIKEIDAVELIGGGIRVPKIVSLLGEHLGGKEIGTHLNGDESQTLGASFHAANLSSSFKTRQIYLSDGYNFDIRVELKDLDSVKSAETDANGEPTGLNKKAVLFPYKTRFGSKKILAFDHTGDINSTFYATLPGNQNEELITSFGVTGLQEALQSNKYKGKDLGTPKVNLHFKMASTGLIELAKAEAVVEEIVLYEVNSTSNASSTTKTEKVDEDGDADGNNGESKETETPVADDTTQETDKKFKVSQYIPAPGPMTEDELEKSRDKLAKFDHYEEIKRKTAEAKNKLEAYLYTTRDFLEEDSFAASAREDEKTQLKEMLTEFDEWLFGGEGSKAGHSALTKKYEDISKVVNTVYHRLDQRLKRPEIIQKARDIFSDMVTRIGELTDTKPWITNETKNQALEHIEETKNWLNEMTEKQEALLHHDDPILTTSTIASKVEKVKELFNRVRSTLKPKAPKNGTNSTGDSENDYYSFGKDGKFDEEKLKEYMRKHNINLNNTNTDGEKPEDGDDTQIPEESKADGDDTQIPEEPKAENNNAGGDNENSEEPKHTPGRDEL